MTIVRTILSAVFVLSAGVWLGASVLLAVVVPQIESALKGRRTEARQLLSRLLETFQRGEMVLMGLAWLCRIASAVLVGVWPEAFGGRMPAEAAALVLLAVPTLAAVYATWRLTPSLRKQEAQLGDFADKNEQIRVRKRIAALLKQAEAMTWLKSAAIAAAMVVAVIAASGGHPAVCPARPQPTPATAPAGAGTGPADTQPAGAPNP